MPSQTIRSAAIRWLEKQKAPPGHLVTSKRYRPDESWTKSKAWWIQVPLSAINAGKLIHIVCQTEPKSRKFRRLQVPATFFRSNARHFALIGGAKVNLFLSADEGMEFQDRRGSGKISFAKFEML
jgi:hypothetical protein